MNKLLSLTVYPIGDYWNAETLTDIDKFYTRQHHGRIELVVHHYDAEYRRAVNTYIDLSQYAIDWHYSEEV